jgi:hypothetical protein
VSIDEPLDSVFQAEETTRAKPEGGDYRSHLKKCRKLWSEDKPRGCGFRAYLCSASKSEGGVCIPP